MTIYPAILLIFRAFPTAVTAQSSGELDCRLVLDTLQAQAREAASLRQNADTLSTALRGSNFALWEKTVEPQLVEVPDAEKDRALEMVNFAPRSLPVN